MLVQYCPRNKSPVRFAYALPAQPAGGEDQENLQVADTEDMSVEQLAEQLKNLKQS